MCGHNEFSRLCYLKYLYMNTAKNTILEAKIALKSQRKQSGKRLYVTVCYYHITSHTRA